MFSLLNKVIIIINVIITIIIIIIIIIINVINIDQKQTKAQFQPSVNERLFEFNNKTSFHLALSTIGHHSCSISSIC